MTRRRSRQSQAGCYTCLVAHGSLEHLVPPGTRPWLTSSTGISATRALDTRSGLKLAPLSCRSTRAYNHGRRDFRPGLLGRSTLKRGGHGLTASAASQRPSPYRLLGFWLTQLSCWSTRAFCSSRKTFRPVPLEHSTLKRGGRGLASRAGLLVTCTRVVTRGVKHAPLSCRSTRAYNHGRRDFRPGLLGRSTLKRGGHGLTASAASQRPSPYRLLGFWLTQLSCWSTRAFCSSRNW